MLGKDHALSGLVAGAAVAEYGLHLHPAGTFTLAGLTAGFATWPDFDQVGSCCARSLGFASGAVAHAVRWVSGGHRHLTHSAVGVAAFTALAWLACHYRTSPAGKVALAAFLALGIAAGLGALRFKHLRLDGHTADAAAVALAAAMAWSGWGLALVPLACGLGCATHILGDACTDRGVPVLAPFTGRRYGMPEPFAFTVGTRPERWVVAPALILALLFLAFHAVTLTGVPLHTALPTHH